MSLAIRDERPADVAVIAAVTRAAFADHPHSSHTEEFIVAALRRAGVLTISLVAEIRDDDVGQCLQIVGHIGFSPVTIADGSPNWFGLGPVAVTPSYQRRGIGRELIEVGLARLRSLGAAGCVLLGEPEYYVRFGFACEPALTLADVPPEYFLALAFDSRRTAGEVRYHEAFQAVS